MPLVSSIQLPINLSTIQQHTAMFQSSDSDYERQKTLHTLMPGTYPMPVKQIITEANKVETPDEQAVHL